MITGGIHVLNVGLPLITEGVEADAVVQLQWKPPAFGDVDAGKAMVPLQDDATTAANAEAMRRMHATRPRLIGVRPAHEMIPVFGQGRTLLHAGPPIAFERMCGPMIGALIGACLFEGWAADATAARNLLATGAVRVDSCHHHGAVGPMAGVLAPSMPVFIVEDDGQRAYASLNEGLGRVLRFGAFDEEVIGRLQWMRDRLGPALDRALTSSEPIDVTSLFAQALTMGDEGHNRNVAATSLLTRRLAPALSSDPDGREVLEFLARNDHFALNLSMAAAKLATDAAADVPGSSVVTAMSRNGVEFGLRVAGTGSRWFTAPVGPADGLFFPGYSIADANPDLGDSAITETLGIGGFAMASAPAITKFVGGTPDDALQISRSMRRITTAPHPAYQLPPLNFSGAPSGIDVLKVLETGVLPVINTGIAHREPGIGQIGAGIVHAPAEVFIQAVLALAATRAQARP